MVCRSSCGPIRLLHSQGKTVGNRDDDIIFEYKSGKEPDELGRMNGVSGRRIKKILSEMAPFFRGTLTE